MDEKQLIDKLRRIESLFAGAKTEGESDAAVAARERIRGLLDQMAIADPPMEYSFSMESVWSKQLFVALLRRYGISPYRYPRQRHTTVMARVSKKFVDATLWPEFRKLDHELQVHLNDVTQRVISEAIHRDTSDVEERSDKERITTSVRT